MKKRLAVAALLVITALMGGAGCRTGDDPAGAGMDPLPWNTPAGWEGRILGVPY